MAGFAVAPDPARERLGALLQKLGGSRAENEELGRPFTSATPFISQTAKYRKKTGETLDLIEDHQMIREPAEIEFGICQFCDV